MAHIICENLSVGYDGKTILSDLNFSINKGDYLCIIGENGSGKSTLMKTLLGLHSPISGNILLGEGLCSNEIGYLPQQTPKQRDFPASVKEIVLSGCQGLCGLRPFYNRAEKKLAEESMKKMGILKLAERSYCELSGGQQQRVLLARALCATQKVVFLDEPVSGLDTRSTTEMYQLIEELNQNSGITVIMISHDIKSVLSYATHILYIGKTVYYGSREEYLHGKWSKELFAIKGGDSHEYDL